MRLRTVAKWARSSHLTIIFFSFICRQVSKNHVYFLNPHTHFNLKQCGFWSNNSGDSSYRCSQFCPCCSTPGRDASPYLTWPLKVSNYWLLTPLCNSLLVFFFKLSWKLFLSFFLPPSLPSLLYLSGKYLHFLGIHLLFFFFYCIHFFLHILCLSHRV